MTGKVFEDTAQKPNQEQGLSEITDTNQIMTGYKRLGDGKYGKKQNAPNEDESGIANVKVTLTEISGTGKKYETTTDADGKFTIENYIAGDYIVTYTWGDNTHTVQDYKGTIYLEKDRLNNLKWWHEKNNTSGRLSDARDNYDQEQDAPKGSREQIDREMQTINQTNITRTKMDATTPKMDISVEYNDGLKDDEYAYAASIGEKYEYLIKDVDFGIIERAKQKLDIKKFVTGIKVTLASGQPIVDATIDEDGKVGGQRKGLIYGPESNGGTGVVKLEMDNEIIQGATVQIEYTLGVKNNGEVDYITEDYYYYGIAGNDSEIVRVKAEVYDYLDEEMKLADDTDDKKDNMYWKEIQKQTYNQQIENTGNGEPNTIVERYYEEEVTQANGIQTKKWKIEENAYKELFIKWEILSQEVRMKKLDGRRVIDAIKKEEIENRLENPFKPTEGEEIKIYATK